MNTLIITTSDDRVADFIEFVIDNTPNCTVDRTSADVEGARRAEREIEQNLTDARNLVTNALERLNEYA